MPISRDIHVETSCYGSAMKTDIPQYHIDKATIGTYFICCLSIKFFDNGNSAGFHKEFKYMRNWNVEVYP